ncbi:MAG: YunC family protein, partial [Promethearchaeota archaeon]
VEGKRAIGMKVELEPAPFLMIKADNGILSCGFINIEAAEKIGVAAAMVSGVKTFEDVLKANVNAVTTQARKRGIEKGMLGRKALLKLF